MSRKKKASQNTIYAAILALLVCITVVVVMLVTTISGADVEQDQVISPPPAAAPTPTLAPATPTPSPTPVPSPTPTPSPTPSPTPTPIPTPKPTPVDLEYPYFIELDKSKQVVTVYTVGEQGYYDLVVKQMICSSSRLDKMTNGMYRLGQKYRWKDMQGGIYAQYANRISGPFLFHSVCYNDTRGNTLRVYNYEELGTNTSSGCVRLLTKDAYWMYENCKTGTPIRVIASDERDEALLEALAPPPLVGKKWDPTDPDPKNPDRVTPSPDTTPEPTPALGVTPAPTPKWTVSPTLKAWGHG